MILLDTSVLIWVLEATPQLGARARDRIAADSAVHVSPISVAEISIKAMTGKLRLPDDLPGKLVAHGFVELPLMNDHATRLGRFPELDRHDPFDRLLVAQAHRTGMDFMTSDRALLKLGRDFIVDARA